MKKIRCYNLEETKKSLSGFFDMNESDLIKLSLEYYSNWKTDLNEHNLAEFCKTFLKQKTLNFEEEVSVYFFHFSRTLNIDRFKKGLFNLTNIKEELLDDLYEKLNITLSLEEWTTFKNEIHLRTKIFYSSLSKKRLFEDDGPNAFLNRESAMFLFESGGSVNYFDGSEFITDVLSKLKNEKGIDVKAEYNNKSKKCVVEFYQILNFTENKDLLYSYLGEAILYVGMLNSEWSNLSSQDIDIFNIAIFNHGKSIESKYIKNIEIL